MNKETRIQKIAEIINRDKNNPYGKQDIPWKDQLEPMLVYKIPLEYLIYNKYNGRILSRTKSLESQGYNIDVESKDGCELIEKLLMDSNFDRNKQTLESIKKIGQEKVGIITRDGIIIDGNRRALLLKKSEKYDYFKTVVLDVTLEENPLEIEKLETTYQMGEDEKLGYNPIEKYLKAKGLDQRGVALDRIADWMGEANSTVKDYLKIMETMDDYLDYLGYNGIYTQLDDREDQFISLTKWLSNFYGEESSKAFDGYKNSDVDDLKIIAFDYIRIKYEGKDFRNIAQGLKENHFFGDRQIWESFRNFHFEHIDPIKSSEDKIKLDSDNLKAYLDGRDKNFFDKTKNERNKSFLFENVDKHKQQVGNKNDANEPIKLVNGAFDALGAINQRHPKFTEGQVVKKLEEINEQTSKMLARNLSDNILSRVMIMLESIDFKDSKHTKDELLNQVNNIRKVIVKIENKINKL